MYLADFHIHSQFSDGKLTISELVDLYGQQGFGAIAITDHLCESQTLLGQSARYLQLTLRKNNFSIYLSEIEREAQRDKKQYNMTVIPGVEITKNSFSHNKSSHILALGVNDYIDPNESVEDLIDAIHHQGALAIAAHPVSTRKTEHQTLYLWKNRERFSSLFDAWEVASGTTFFQEVYDSGLPMLANSDLHRKIQINSWKNEMSGKMDKQSIFKAIRNQNLDFKYYSENQFSESS